MSGVWKRSTVNHVSCQLSAKIMPQASHTVPSSSDAERDANDSQSHPPPAASATQTGALRSAATHLERGLRKASSVKQCSYTWDVVSLTHIQLQWIENKTKPCDVSSNNVKLLGARTLLGASNSPTFQLASHNQEAICHAYQRQTCQNASACHELYKISRKPGCEKRDH